MPESTRTAPVVRHLMRRLRVTLSPDMDARAAAAALAAAGADAAPVVDATGRCVGLFTAGDYWRWLTAAVTDVFSEGQMVAPADRVGDHMSRRFTTAARAATGGHALYLDP